MAPPKKLLYVCSRNRWRSPTAEKLFDGVDGLQARSAGTELGARIRVTAGHLGWADVIFVMEKKHLRRLREKFADELAIKTVVCLEWRLDKVTIFCGICCDVGVLAFDDVDG